MGSQILDTMMQCFDLVKYHEKMHGYHSNSDGNHIFSYETLREQNIENGCHHGRPLIYTEYKKFDLL